MTFIAPMFSNAAQYKTAVAQPTFSGSTPVASSPSIAYAGGSDTAYEVITVKGINADVYPGLAGVARNGQMDIRFYDPSRIAKRDIFKNAREKDENANEVIGPCSGAFDKQQSFELIALLHHCKNEGVKDKDVKLLQDGLIRTMARIYFNTAQ